MTGTITLSLEIELGWGVNHLSDPDRLGRHSHRRTTETETLEALLELCDELSIPISFDIVGHLLLEECSGTHTGPYAGGWFDSDPGTNVDVDPLYYAPDLVRRIRASETDHEICTHTFSHILCHEAPCDVIDNELRRVRDVHADFGLPGIRSFVPPVHAPPPYDVLSKHGIRVIRQPMTFEPPVGTVELPESVLRRIPVKVQRLYPFQVLDRSIPVRRPRVVDGVVEIYTTWHTPLTAPFLPNGQREVHPAFRLLPQAIRRYIHQQYLEQTLQRTIEADSYGHLWSHLFNLSNDVQWPLVRSFLRTLADQRNLGSVEVMTMEALGRSILQQ